MELGNRLVTDKGYLPAGYRGIPNTGAIKQFTDWLNRTRDAREILSELGVEWPVTQQQEVVEDFGKLNGVEEAEQRFAEYRERGGKIEHRG